MPVGPAPASARRPAGTRRTPASPVPGPVPGGVGQPRRASPRAPTGRWSWAYTGEQVVLGDLGLHPGAGQFELLVGPHVAFDLPGHREEEAEIGRASCRERV